MALAAKVAAQPPLSVAMTKLTVNRLAHALDDLASHMDVDQFALASMTEDHKEGVAAFLERRKPRFRGGSARRDSNDPQSRISRNSHKVYYGIFISTIRSDIYAESFCQTHSAARHGCPGVRLARAILIRQSLCCRRLRTLQ